MLFFCSFLILQVLNFVQTMPVVENNRSVVLKSYLPDLRHINININMNMNMSIFPGTKWCGIGNISKSLDDLGKYSDTDMCCRAHDLCPEYIEAYQTKYNLTNSHFYSRLHCSCDEEFYRCLKSVGNVISFNVGFLYFSLFGAQCFKYDYPILSCSNSTLFRLRCTHYVYKTNESKEYQWFDNPYFT